MVDRLARVAKLEAKRPRFPWHLPFERWSAEEMEAIRQPGIFEHLSDAELVHIASDVALGASIEWLADELLSDLGTLESTRAMILAMRARDATPMADWTLEQCSLEHELSCQCLRG